MTQMSDSEHTLGALLAAATERLAASSESPRLDAELLLAHVLGQPRSHLFAWPDRPADGDQRVAYARLIERRANGEPVAYLTGLREFWSLPVRITADVLIPRPETELLVEVALEYLPDKPQPSIADLGTGSGVIALALARECPRCRIIATDCSEGALTTARLNAEQLHLTHIEFRLGSWFGPLEAECFDLIISNPPYIAENDPHLAQGDLRFEPKSALVSGRDGMDDLRVLAQNARRHLHAGGWLIVEHGYDQGEAVRKLLDKEGFSSIATRRDLAGVERVTLGRHA
ncbi:MAG TPA: peptide chain release factor N(5)-glutamine methyltransferase [Thioalkalivibrio sp.]|nr:peptide chain release factor N(5)-glutamine methyltransferase [Thioalkalivibrio sp.]